VHADIWAVAGSGMDIRHPTRWGVFPVTVHYWSFFLTRILILLVVLVFPPNVFVDKLMRWPMLASSRHLQYQQGLLLASYPRSDIRMVSSAGNNRRLHAHATSAKRKRRNARANSRAGHATVGVSNVATMQSMLEGKRLRHAV
jgi:hypothetical protein